MIIKPSRLPFSVQRLDTLTQTLHTLHIDFENLPPTDYRAGVAQSLHGNCMRQLDRLRITPEAIREYYNTVRGLHRPTTLDKESAILAAMAAHPYTKGA